MKIRSLVVAGVAAGALVAPVAAPAVPSIQIPASGPAGAELVQVAGKKGQAKNQAKKAQAKKQRKAAKRKAAAQAGGRGGEARAASNRKGAGKAKAERREARKAERKAGKRQAAARRADGKAPRKVVREWREDRRDERREARREELRRDDPRLLYRHGNRDDPRPPGAWRDDDGWREDRVARAGWREDDRRDRWDDRRDRWEDERDRWEDRRDRWDDDRRRAWREEERRRWIGWRDARDVDRYERYGWRDASWDRYDDRDYRRDRSFLLFAPTRDARWSSGWSEPRRVRVIDAGSRWARPRSVSPAVLAAPVFGWRPAPVTSLYGLGSTAHAYPYGWDARPATRVVRVADGYPTRVYRTGYASPYSTGYQAWRPSAFDVGYASFGSGSLFGDLSSPLTALLLAALL